MMNVLMNIVIFLIIPYINYYISKVPSAENLISMNEHSHTYQAQQRTDKSFSLMKENHDYLEEGNVEVFIEEHQKEGEYSIKANRRQDYSHLSRLMSNSHK